MGEDASSSLSPFILSSLTLKTVPTAATPAVMSEAVAPALLVSINSPNEVRLKTVPNALLAADTFQEMAVAASAPGPFKAFVTASLAAAILPEMAVAASAPGPFKTFPTASLAAEILPEMI